MSSNSLLSTRPKQQLSSHSNPPTQSNYLSPIILTSGTTRTRTSRPPVARLLRAVGGMPLTPQHSTLDTQHSTLNTQFSTLNTQHSTLNTQHSTLSNQHSTLNTQHSTFHTPHSTLNTQHTTLNHQQLGTALNFRTTTLQKCAVVPRRARIRVS